MRAMFRVEIEADPAHKRKKLVVLHLPNGETEVLAYDLKEPDAARMLVPLRKALLAGITWMREEASSFVLAVHPNVTCSVEEP